MAIGGVNGFVSTEVQNSASVLRIKFSAKNPAHRQYAARWLQYRNYKVMGYDLHITRQDEWYNEDENLRISLKEWTQFVNSDNEMRMDGQAEVTLDTGEVLTIESEGLAVWTAYSGEGVDQNHAWFSLSNGNIVVKNPDTEIINKMVDISNYFNAKVQGDEGELYQKEDYLKSQINVAKNPPGQKKPWWRFW